MGPQAAPGGQEADTGLLHTASAPRLQDYCLFNQNLQRLTAFHLEKLVPAAPGDPQTLMGRGGNLPNTGSCPLSCPRFSFLSSALSGPCPSPGWLSRPPQIHPTLSHPPHSEQKRGLSEKYSSSLGSSSHLALPGKFSLVP